MNDIEIYDLTIPQKSIYLTEQYASGTSINLISGNVIIEEKINLDLLEKALNLYVLKNAATRIRICMIDGEPKQYINKYAPFKPKRFHFSNEEDLSTLSTKIVNTPFNFLNSDLFSFTLFSFDNGTGGLNATFHHIISDAWSMSLFVDEIINIYSHLLDGNEVDTSLNYSYTEFIDSQKKYFNDSRFQKDKDFWNGFFDSEPIPSLISDKTENFIDTSSQRKIYFLDGNLYSRIVEFCKYRKCSIYTFFMAIYSIYLSRINNTNVSTIGTPVLNRTTFKEKQTAGMFVSTMPFSINIDFESSFDSFLENVISNQMKFFRHQKYPYSVLLEDLKDKYDFSSNLYDVAISYQNARVHNTTNVKFHSKWLFNNNCSDTLQIHFYDMDNTGTTQIYYDYQVSKLSDEDIDNIHSRIIEIVNQVLDNSLILLKDIDILTPNERNKLLNDFNNSIIPHPRNIGVHELIEKIASKFPDNIAVTYNSEILTYKELVERSTVIAENLISHGIEKGDCVSVLFKNKDINLICSMLGILKSGATFLAIYSDYPNERIEYILKNSNSKLLITESCFSNTNFGVPTLFIEELNKINAFFEFPTISSDDPAYIIYTSGSTGNPKGTIQTHNNLINFVYSFNNFLDNSITPNDVFLSVTNICFDVSMAEIFTSLIFGCNLHLYKDLNCSSTVELAKYIINNNITFSYFPPSMLHDIYAELKKYDNIKLNKLLVGVEPIKVSTLLNFLSLNPDMKIINGYGPSETTICCTMFKFNNKLPPSSITPIGIPIGNSKIFILDKMKKLVPIGGIGEIYVQGECVGNGYLNNPEKTQASFDLQNRIYKTGDSAKWLPDGNIQFVGRNDNQIKYRGYRIDLGEIESTIRKISGVKNCTVLLNTFENNNSSLIAFIILDNSKLNEENFRNILVSKLPHYMMPSQFMFVDDFPLNTNGKIDKKKLVVLANENYSTHYLAPQTELEKLLVKIWCDTLKIEKIGIEDNFFSIGGDSLSAIKIAATASKYNIDLSAQSFYKYPTIKLLVKYAINTTVSDTVAKESSVEYFPLEKTVHSNLNGNILLVGATGFLGSHMLYELLHKTNFKIYCLIRGTTYEQAKSRLKERLQFYFDKKLDFYFENRIIVLKGDFSEENLGLSEEKYHALLKDVKSVINSAATVKHLGDYSYFEKINITGVKNLIKFCKDSSDSNLVHISTLSIAGSKEISKNSYKFTEKDFFVNQSFGDNVYIQTKFVAEKLLLEELKNGLDVTIFRLGNITWRTNDGKFQFNRKENLFFNIMNYIIKCKLLPIDLKNTLFNLSPVEDCSNAIVSILLNNNINNVYHIYNQNELRLEQIVYLLNTYGLNIKFIDNKEAIQVLEKNFDKINLSTYIYEILNSRSTENNIRFSNPYTLNVLKSIGFNWSPIDKNYFKKGLEEFFNEELK